MTEDGVATSYTYDAANRLLSSTTGDTVKTYTYDDNGNLLSETGGGAEGIEYTYNAANQLTEVQIGDLRYVYRYYPNGLRKAKELYSGSSSTPVSTTEYVWSGDQLVLEIKGDSVSHYFYGLDLYGYSAGRGTTSYYVNDGHGSVELITDEYTAVENGYTYDAFGNVDYAYSGDTNPFRYCGEYYDSETGNYYLRARYYDPTIGRFTQEDTYRGEITNPHSLNYYIYCYNDPVKYVDKSGNVPIDVIFDFASLCWSAVELKNNPSWKNLGYLLWDFGSMIIPYAPGSYVAKGIKMLGKVDDVVDVSKGIRLVTKIDDGVDVVKFAKDGNILYGSYRDMKKYTAGYNGAVQAHHLLEQRFRFALDFDVNDMISVVLTKEQHQIFTKRWSKAVPYGSDYSNLFKSWADIRQIAQNVYHGHPELFKLLDDYMNSIN